MGEPVPEAVLEDGGVLEEGGVAGGRAAGGVLATGCWIACGAELPARTGLAAVARWLPRVAELPPRPKAAEAFSVGGAAKWYPARAVVSVWARAVGGFTEMDREATVAATNDDTSAYREVLETAC